MSEYLAAAAAAVGGPEDLVARSASARAQAQGVSADDILQAWAGGGSVTAPAPAPVEASAPVSDVVEVVEQPVEAPAPAASAPAAATVEAAAPAAVLVAEEPVDFVEPALLGDRIRFPGKLGAMLGFMMGMFALVVATPFLFDKVSLGGTEDDPALLWLIQPARLVLFIAFGSAVFGAIIARLSGVVPSWFDKGLSVRSSGRSLYVVGAGVGALLGVVGAGVLLATGTSVEVLPEEPALTELTIVPVMIVVLAGGALLGAITAIVAQVMALPVGLSEEEQVESEVIQHRLATSYIMPAMVILIIALLVVPFGILLVEFHTVAPLIAVITAGGILTFGFLSASQPGMRIGVGEALVAAAGIGTLVLFIVLMANAVGQG